MLCYQFFLANDFSLKGLKYDFCEELARNSPGLSHGFPLEVLSLDATSGVIFGDKDGGNVAQYSVAMPFHVDAVSTNEVGS